MNEWMDGWMGEGKSRFYKDFYFFVEMVVGF